MHKPTATTRPGFVWPAITFLLVITATAAVCLLSVLSGPDYTSFARPENLFRCIVGAELFFFVFLWPQFVFRRTGPGHLAVEAALLGALSLPVLLTSVVVADPGLGAVLKTHALLACAAWAVIAFARAGGLERWYYLGATALCVALAIAAYLVYDVLDVSLPWLAAFSPFWAMDKAARPDGVWPLVAMVVLASAAAGAGFLKNRQDSP